METNIVFYNIQYPYRNLERCFIGSIRRHMPHAVVTQLSDMTTPAVDGVDRVVRSPSNYVVETNNIHYIGFVYLCQLDLDSFILSDMDMLYNADVSNLLEGDFDFAACPRHWGLRKRMRDYPIRNWFPYPSVMVIKNRQFLKDCYAQMLSKGVRSWEDNMWAVGAVARSGNYRVKQLYTDEYNYIPQHKDDYSPDAKVFHIKGLKINAEYFYDKYIARTDGRQGNPEGVQVQQQEQEPAVVPADRDQG